jgi:acyl-lipid omega-6 desaturase (Delta-12 desaturase)
VAALKRFEQPDSRKAALQIADTLFPYLALLTLMYLTILWGMPYIVTFLLAIPASAFMVRLFILFHDCAHGSYLASPGATKILGTCLGILVFMPFFEWSALHAGHHSSSGNLDRRGIGDVWTMTVNEYHQSPGIRRFLYRIFRHPAIMFGLGPIYVLLIAHRLPSRGARKDRILSVIFTDLAIAAMISVAVLVIGIKACLMIGLPIIFMGGAAGVWLFYIQHQFDPSYWTRSDQWNSMEAALQGSSFYKLPKLLQWFSGNIGFHHIHHLRPRIPNYNLERCLKETPELQLDCPLTLWRSLKSVRLNLWDEECRILVSFREAARSRRA